MVSYATNKLISIKAERHWNENLEKGGIGMGWLFGKTADDWFQEGNKLLGLGKCEEAINCYDKALEINPKCAYAWRSKGLALLALEKYEEAINCFDEALEIDPNVAEAWYNKGLALLALGRNEEVINCYDKALEINPDADAWHNKGLVLSMLEKYNEAINCYDRALEINPELTEARENRVIILKLIQAQNYEKALRYEDAIKIYEELEMWDDAGRVRKLQKEEISPKIQQPISQPTQSLRPQIPQPTQQPVFHINIGKIGDEDKSTTVKDSVLMKSKIGKEEKQSNCPSCGEEVKENWKICPNCQASLQKNIVKTCPNCGESVKPTWKVCPNCEKVI